MKPCNRILILVAASFLWACGPKPIAPPLPVTVDPGYEIFSSAEDMFQAKSYWKALETYNEYLLRFPDRDLAAAALMKMGAIYTALDKNAESRSIYKRLIADYPDSPFVQDAMVELLVTFYNEGKYREVIRMSAGILETTASRVHFLRTYTLVGDAYMAIGSPVEAVNFYAMAYEKSKDPGDPEKERIIVKIEDALRQLGTADIISLLRRLEDKLPMGYLIYRLGHNNFGEERYEDAVTLLSEFVERFPGHENVQQAKSLIQEINKKFAYDLHTIGCLLPLSGPYKIYGDRALKCIELALSQFNSQKNNAPIKIIVKDTGSDSDRAATAVKELSKERVAAIIGPFVTDEHAALEAQDKRIPIIALTQNDNITDIGDYVFRNFLTPKMQVKAVVSYAIGTLGLNTFAILYPEENYGTTFMDLFKDEVIANGGIIVGVESYNPTHTDFADPIKKLVHYYEEPEDLKNISILSGDEKIYKNEEPKSIVDFDAIFIPDGPTKAGLIIPQLAFYDVEDVYLFGTNLWHSDRLIEMAEQYVQGAIMPDGFFAESDSKKVRDFVRIFKETFGENPGFIEAITYDIAMILFQIVNQPDIRLKSELKDELMNLRNFQGVTGLTSFDKNGDVHKKPYLLRIKGEKFIELEHY